MTSYKRCRRPITPPPFSDRQERTDTPSGTSSSSALAASILDVAEGEFNFDDLVTQRSGGTSPHRNVLAFTPVRSPIHFVQRTRSETWVSGWQLDEEQLEEDRSPSSTLDIKEGADRAVVFEVKTPVCSGVRPPNEANSEASVEPQEPSNWPEV
ncbi:hypothetical protein M3Y99_00758100 [Aphelenchoides fujianensis]|nr:hypothetical protein M3Y99_00758100 [Aphelenchoides fujianensis]